MPHEDTSIAELAYSLWEARGRPQGTAESDWLEAERQLAEKKSSTRPETPPSSKALDASLKDSFPASDPPASHLPDEPPSNAEAKWKAAGVKRVAGRPPTPR